MTPLLLHDDSAVSGTEYAQIAASRLMYSPSCGVFYASLLAASLTEIVWILHPWMDQSRGAHIRVAYPRSRIFFAVETYLTLGLVGETTLRFVWQRSAFWLSCNNWFDAIVCGMSCLSFFLYWKRASVVLEEAFLLVVLVWLVLRIARLVTIIQKIRQRRRTMADHLDVAFPEEEDSEDEQRFSPGSPTATSTAIPIVTPPAREAHPKERPLERHVEERHVERSPLVGQQRAAGSVPPV